MLTVATDGDAASKFAVAVDADFTRHVASPVSKSRSSCALLLSRTARCHPPSATVRKFASPLRSGHYQQPTPIFARSASSAVCNAVLLPLPS